MISIEEIQNAWGWGFKNKIQEVVKMNTFGNILVRSENEIYRILPEDCSIEYVCTVDELDSCFANEEFVDSWEMKNWEIPITEILGDLPKDRVIAFKIPRVLGGQDEITNIYYANPHDYIGGMGQVASQIHDLPDGTNIELKVD
ncbi:MAG: DUF1851 domain-containing protein [Spirochaetes bacterium]|nr:DUF1851 domain-containing protein [Spirochaetota bacterium]